MRANDNDQDEETLRISDSCVWCDEPLTSRDRCFASLPAHPECSIRMVFGPAAHLEGRCACVRGAFGINDEEGLTRREAARAAVRVLERRTGLTLHGHRAAPASGVHVRVRKCDA